MLRQETTRESGGFFYVMRQGNMPTAEISRNRAFSMQLLATYEGHEFQELHYWA
jgi:hypothetical protein